MTEFIMAVVTAVLMYGINVVSAAEERWGDIARRTSLVLMLAFSALAVVIASAHIMAELL